MKMKRISLVLMVIAGLLFAVNQAEAAKPKTENVKFWVSMSCMSCQQKIKDNLSFEKGVKDLQIDLASKTVDISFDPKKTTADKLKTTIEKLGFEVRVMQPGETAQKAATTTDKQEKAHQCAGQKDAAHKCAGEKGTEHKCTGHKDADHKCSGQKTTEHKCTGSKDPEHKCTGAQKSSDTGATEHKCSGHKTDSGSTETKTHNCNHGVKQ
jgi:periplasmic mercuric ion binding protein